MPSISRSDLGEDQRFAYDALVTPRTQIRSPSAVCAIVTGIAGSGKSQLIHAIKNTLEDQCRVFAKTAAASFNVSGRLLSSLLTIGSDHDDKRELTVREKRRLRTDLEQVSCLLIDEYSMFVFSIIG